MIKGYDPNSANHLPTFAVALARIACLDGPSTSADLPEIESIAAEVGLATKATWEPGESA